MERTPSIILEWQAQARAEGKVEGRAEGEAKGKVEGRAEGRAEGLQLGIATVLELRFGTVPGPEVTDRLTAQTDPTTLKLWLEKATTTSSIQDFLSSIHAT